MWLSADLNEDQVNIFQRIIVNLYATPQIMEGVNSTKVLLLIIQYNQSVGGVQHRISFSPSTYELMSSIEPELLKIQANHITQPENIGKDWNFLYGDRNYFQSLKTISNNTPTQKISALNYFG